jgi:hypothetical protein
LRVVTACGVTASIRRTSAPVALAFSISELNCVLSTGNDWFDVTV